MPPASPGRPLRNLGIVAHIDAGKTTLTEQILHATGVVRRAGSVEDASTVTDWMVPEQERGITIGSAAVTCRWRDVELTLVDTPGHVDFTIEVERALTALDGLVVVLSAPDGIQAQTQTVWHQAARRHLPVLGFVNKLDRPGVDPDRLSAEIRDRLGIEPLPLQIPLAWGEDRLELLDVLAGELLVWDGIRERSGTRPPDRRPLAHEDDEVLRALALEAIADRVASHDDAFAAAVLAGETPPAEAWLGAIAAATAARACLPLLYGVARTGAGVEALLDAIVALLPSPDASSGLPVYDRATGREAGRWRGRAEDRPAAFVFKTERRRGGRRVAWVRVLSGTLAPGAGLARLPTGQPYEVPRLVRLLGGSEVPVPALAAGDVGALAPDEGAPLPATGETLAEADATVTFESVRAPTPVIAVGVEAANGEEDARMRRALAELLVDDPSLALLTDRDSGRTLLAGMGELHLELAVERLRRDEGLAVRTGAPAPRRRSMIARAAAGTGTYRADTVPGGEVTVEVAVAPQAGAGGVGLGEQVPPREDWAAALEAGLRQALEIDADVVAARVEVTALRHRGGSLTPRAFWIAGHRAVEDALARAGVGAAEPWMGLSIAVPDDQVGRVTGDLARRRGRVLASTSRGALQVLSAEAPLAELIRYATELRSLTGGRASFTMEPLGYRPV